MRAVAWNARGGVQRGERAAGGVVAAAAGAACLSYGFDGWAAFFVVVAALDRVWLVVLCDRARRGMTGRAAPRS